MLFQVAVDMAGGMGLYVDCMERLASLKRKLMGFNVDSYQ